MNRFNQTLSGNKFQSAKEDLKKKPKLIEGLLDANLIRSAMKDEQIEFRNRLYSPLTTLWIFLNQVLYGDHSCRAAVAQYLPTLRNKTGSLSTGGYCQARKRLSEKFIRTLLVKQAEHLQKKTPREWLWRKRFVKLVDGSTLSLPDTGRNQKYFPATNRKQNPLEFPILRMVVIICKSTGILLNVAIGSYQGKGSGESSLLRDLFKAFRSGDICVFDRYYSSFFCLASLMQRGVDCVSRQHHLRDLKVSRKLNKKDFIFKVTKPSRSSSLSEKEYSSLPSEITLRLIRVIINKPGFRTKGFEVITSLIDPKISAQDIAELYRDRWFVEMDLRSIKADMGMKVLRCQTPEMIRKEILVYFLAYNLIRSILMDSAFYHRKKPRELSFKAALQVVFFSRIQMTLTSKSEWFKIYLNMITSLKNQSIGNRPNRYEPRLKKRRPNDKYLTIPRLQARLACLNPIP